MPSDLKRVGALWLKEGKKGKFMSGSFEPEGREGPKYKFLVFKNTRKEKANDPDYTINMSAADRPARRKEGSDVSDNDESPL